MLSDCPCMLVHVEYYIPVHVFWDFVRNSMLCSGGVFNDRGSCQYQRERCERSPASLHRLTCPHFGTGKRSHCCHGNEWRFVFSSMSLIICPVLGPTPRNSEHWNSDDGFTKWSSFVIATGNPRSCIFLYQLAWSALVYLFLPVVRVDGKYFTEI